MGTPQPGALARAFRGPARQGEAPRQGPGGLRLQRLRRRRPALPPAGAGDQRVRLAQPLRAQHVRARDRSRQAGRLQARLHGGRLPQPEGGPGRRRHLERHFHRAQFRPPDGADRRHRVRRRDEEVDLLGDELPAPQAGHPLHALRRQLRADEGRRGALLRALRDRQDHALGGSPAHPGRRRRARLGGGRHLQHRGRLLRQGHPAVGRRRARHLRHHAPLRHGARERGLRPRDPPSRPGRSIPHREHPRLLRAGADPQRRPHAASPATRRRSSSSPPTPSGCCRRSPA